MSLHLTDRTYSLYYKSQHIVTFKGNASLCYQHTTFAISVLLSTIPEFKLDFT